MRGSPHRESNPESQRLGLVSVPFSLCGGSQMGESNPQALASTSTSSWRVCHSTNQGCPGRDLNPQLRCLKPADIPVFLPGRVEVSLDALLPGWNGLREHADRRPGTGKLQ